MMLRAAASGSTLIGHTSRVQAAEFSPDSNRIVTASHDQTAKVWDATTGRELLTLEGHTRMVTSAAFLPDGGRILTAGNDGLIKIWEGATSQQIARWNKQ